VAVCDRGSRGWRIAAKKHEDGGKAIKVSLNTREDLGMRSHVSGETKAAEESKRGESARENDEVFNGLGLLIVAT
jgi:hypothetical protein